MSPPLAFLRALLLLATIALVERAAFAGYHSQLSTALGLGDLAGALLAGLRFDFAIAAMLATAAYLAAYLAHRFSPFRFLAIFRGLIFVAVAALVVVHGADLLYFDETGRHLGYELKEAYNSSGELLGSAVGTYPWPVAAQLALLALAWVAVHRLLPGADPRARRMFAPSRRWYHRFAPEGHLLLVVICAAVLARGGLQSVPLEPLHAQAAGHPHRAALTLNGAYNAVFSSLTPYRVDRVLDAAPTEAQKALVRGLYGAPHATQASEKNAGPAPNVIVVFLESWSASHMGSYGNGAVTTPFFDELRSRSFTTRDMLAGGHRTTEGLFAALCSAQNPLGATVAQSQLQNYGYDCLPKLLREQGYHTAFFQGTVSGTSGTGAFVQLLGFQHSYGKEHVSQYRLPHNSWGLQDPDLYEFALAKMASLPQPFLVGINTNSTHDHALPPDAPAPFDGATSTGRYQNVLHFSDGALREFVATVSRQYPDTVLVVLSDHAGPHRGPVIDSYRIPFLIHAPGRVAPTTVDTVATQRDVTPTLFQVLGLPQAPWFTGRSLLEPGGAGATGADYYHAGILGWIEGETGIEWPVRDPSATRCFAARGDFAAMPCTEDAREAAQRGLALTTVLQDLLFRGRLGEFRDYRRAASQNASGDGAGP